MNECPRCGAIMKRFGINSFSCMECGITKYIHGGYQHTFEDENGNPYYPKYEQQNEKTT